MNDPDHRKFATIRKGSIPFVIPEDNLRRYIFVNPDYFDAMNSLNNSGVVYVWVNFFGSFTKLKKINYELFKPSWLDGLAVFVTGREKTKLVEAFDDKMLTQHGLRKMGASDLAKCILSTWLSREKATSPLLVQRLAEKGVQITLADIPDPVTSVNRNDCNLTAAAMQTLLPNNIPAHSVLNAFSQSFLIVQRKF